MAIFSLFFVFLSITIIGAGLIDGFNLKTLDSLVVAGGVATGGAGNCYPDTFVDDGTIQGWGWAAQSNQIRALLPELQRLYAMDEQAYLDHVAAHMNDEIRGRLEHLDLDLAMLAGLRALVADATADFEAFDYARALERTETSFWAWTWTVIAMYSAIGLGMGRKAPTSG